MSFNDPTEINLHTAFTLAENIAKEKSPKAKFILDLIVNKKDRGYLNLCYAYLRSVDDFVDDPQKPIPDKIDFISRQKKILKKILLSQNEFRLNTEESFLYYFVTHAISQNKLFLIDAVETMLESIEMDAQRLTRNGIYTSSEINLYIDKNSKAFFDIMTGFVEPNNLLIRNNIFIGRFATRLFMLRDFADDVQLGFINIAKEDLELYLIDSFNLPKDNNLKFWVRDEFYKLIKLLFEEAMIVKNFSFKLKIFNYYSQIYYLPRICRIAAYNYDIFKAKYHRGIKTEVSAYLLAAKLSVKLFIKEIF